MDENEEEVKSAKRDLYSSVPLFGLRNNFWLQSRFVNNLFMALSMYRFKTERLHLAASDRSIRSFLENRPPQQKCGWSMKFSSKESSLPSPRKKATHSISYRSSQRHKIHEKQVVSFVKASFRPSFQALRANQRRQTNCRRCILDHCTPEYASRDSY